MDLSDSKVRRRVNKAFRERGVPAKACGKCFVVKGYAAFNASASSSDGRQNWCVRCRAAWREANREHTVETARQYYEANRERVAERSRRWHEANRERRAETNRQWAEANRERCAESNRRWREANQERKAENNRRWKSANRDRVRAHSQERRAIKAQTTIEPFTARDLRQDWEDHDLYACFFCGGPLTDGYEVEHFHPLSKGGPHALFNLVPSCSPCNRGAGGKGTKEPWSYLRESLAEQGTDLDACLAGLEAIAARRRP